MDMLKYCETLRVSLCALDTDAIVTQDWMRACVEVKRISSKVPKVVAIPQPQVIHCMRGKYYIVRFLNSVVAGRPQESSLHVWYCINLEEVRAVVQAFKNGVGTDLSRPYRRRIAMGR